MVLLYHFRKYFTAVIMSMSWEVYMCKYSMQVSTIAAVKVCVCKMIVFIPGVVVAVVIRFSKYKNFSVSQPILIKLQLLIGDSILNCCIVLYF